MNSFSLKTDAGGIPVDELVAKRIGISYKELSQERVEEYQLEAFKRTLRYAKERSDFYAEKYKDIDPDDIKDLNDIELLPTSSEKDLAGNEWRFRCIDAASVDRIVTVPTTGTGGMQKRLSFDEDDQRRAIEFIQKGYEVMNCQRGEKMLVLMSGNSTGSIGDLVYKAVTPLGMTIDVFGSVTDIKEAYEKLMDLKPEVIEAVPWHAAALASYGKRFGNPEKVFIRSANLSADVVPDSIVQRLEKLWECTVHRHYGSTEMCIFGGVECSNHEGYHLRPCDILYEIPETDEEGKGEIIITTLDRKAMPLIRYKTGDIGKFTDKECSCGGKLKRLLKVYGRKSSIIHLGKENIFLSDIADAVYRCDEVVDFDISVKDAQHMAICVKYLEGHPVNMENVKNDILSIDGIKGNIDENNCCVEISLEETKSFPSGYNLKKNIS